MSAGDPERFPTRPQILLAADMSDPLVLSVRRSLDKFGNALRFLDWPENAPLPAESSQAIPDCITGPFRIVVHRRGLGHTELAATTEIRARANLVSGGRVEIDFLVGDLARYAEVQTIAALVDRIVPEAIAADVLAPRLERSFGLSAAAGDSVVADVGILSTNRPLAETLAAWVDAFGHRPKIVDGWSDPLSSRHDLLIWDAPILSGRWLVRLRDQARRRSVLVLLGMAHRDIVAQAKAAGAVACLDLPFEAEDLRNLLSIHAAASRRRIADEPRSPALPSVSRTDRTGPILRTEAGHGPASQRGRSASRSPWRADFPAAEARSDD
jgi:hypothetical protein